MPLEPWEDQICSVLLTHYPYIVCIVGPMYFLHDLSDWSFCLQYKTSNSSNKTKAVSVRTTIAMPRKVGRLINAYCFLL